LSFGEGKLQHEKGSIMALLYGMFCGWIVVLRKLALRKHNRLKKNYETAEKAFRHVERDCKNDEVAVGRPGAYSAQLKLMKRYEAVDFAKTRWIAAKRKLGKRERIEGKVKSLKGRKIPYTFGLLDMAVIVKGVDAFREAARLNLGFVSEYVQSFF
jgi:hypothetical protein